MFHHHFSKIKSISILFGFFLMAFIAGPYAQLDHLLMMPGDIGDARLNNYFLENIYLFIQGRSPSLIHLGFFYPFPYVLGFSDNLFGSSPAYLIPRFLTGQPDTAFQIWFLLGYLVNYIAAYYALRKLEASVIASAVGALVFTFALPVAAQAGHAQLHYRFGVPLSIAMFILFLESKEWRNFALAVVWLVWQFYCSIYIGFFLLLFLMAMSSIYVFRLLRVKASTLKTIVMSFADTFINLSRREKIGLIAVFVVVLVLLALLFYPYIQVSALYHVKRHWREIATMLPRPQSYFFISEPWLWSPQSEFFANIPMLHEQQMFVGIVPLLLAIAGVWVGCSKNSHQAFPLLGGALGLLILLTLYVGGFSLWYVFSKFPLASAIRAMSRIILVFLFPVAFLSAIAVDKLRVQAYWGRIILFVVLIPALVFEFSALSLMSSPKAVWRDRVIAADSALPNNLPQHAILFFAQGKGPFYADEIDAMWVGLMRGIPVLNGYSGVFPPDYLLEYDNDCTELPRRIQSYLNFSGQKENAEAYLKLMKRIVPIGFIGCNPDWFIKSPSHTSISREYAKNEFRALSYEYIGRGKFYGKEYVDIKINNSGKLPISAVSEIDKPVRLSWRFIDLAGNPLSGWDARKDLPLDVPANGSLNVRIPIDLKLAEHAAKLQVSMVQEMVFGGHEIGVTPLTIDWMSE